MYLAIDMLLVGLGIAMLVSRHRLARYMARMQERQADATPWAYPGWLGRVNTSERAWRLVFVPILGLAFIAVGALRLWTPAYQ